MKKKNVKLTPARLLLVGIGLKKRFPEKLMSVVFILFSLVHSLQANEALITGAIIEPPSINGNNSFAMLIDSTTFVNVGNVLLRYRQTIENDGLPTYIIVGNWNHPEQVREIIVKLYQQKKQRLEGFVLIGEIPLVMLQDAQYLTSAFRMNQFGRSLSESSVPTDRFYDDLDLKCEYITQDSTNALIHYYRLLSESPVRLQRELYSARIPVLQSSKNKYKILKQYFRKVVRVKSAPRESLDRIITLNGYNYISDSYAAIIDELFTLREVLGLTRMVNSRIHQIFHRISANPKQQLFHTLKLSDGDLFILHSHGNEETQIIKENVSNTFIADENVSSPSRETSTDESDATISIEEINRQIIETEFVILDVCYNGAFQYERNMAAAYLFSRGQVVTVMANSVNVRQDIATIENLGALAFGARVGHWHQLENYLESHLFGDPTFRFASIVDHDSKLNLPFERNDISAGDLEDIFKKSDLPYLRASALAALHKNHANRYEKYLEPALADPANIVRLKAWLILATERSETFLQHLPEGLNDSYELIRRYCAMWMGEIGSNNFVQHLARTAIEDPSERVVFNALISLKLIGTKEARTALKWVLSEISNFDDGKFIQQVRANLFTISQWLPNEVIPPLTSGSVAEKIKHIRLFRANRHLVALPYLLFLYENDESPEVRTVAAETIGWYGFYEKRNVILEIFSRILEQEGLDENIRAATDLARRRLIEGANKPNTP